MNRPGPLFVTAAASALLSCGGGAEEARPFTLMGHSIEFRSMYAHFPSDFAVTIVKDTLAQDEACRLLGVYKKPPLPAPTDHYSLIILIQSAQAGDDVTIDIDDRGTPGDMRSAGLGLYPAGSGVVPAHGFGIDAGGVVRVRELVRYSRVAGSFHLKFRTGETLMDSFDISTCPEGSPP
jgi:hypothetical protein